MENTEVSKLQNRIDELEHKVTELNNRYDQLTPNIIERLQKSEANRRKISDDFTSLDIIKGCTGAAVGASIFTVTLYGLTAVGIITVNTILWKISNR